MVLRKAGIFLFLIASELNFPIVILPLSGIISICNNFNSDVLPEPVGPIRNTNSPASILRLIFARLRPLR